MSLKLVRLSLQLVRLFTPVGTSVTSVGTSVASVDTSVASVGTSITPLGTSITPLGTSFTQRLLMMELPTVDMCDNIKIENKGCKAPLELITGGQSDKITVDEEEVVTKFVNKKDRAKVRFLKHEIVMLSNLHHPNIISFLGITEDECTIGLKTPFAGMDLTEKYVPHLIQPHVFRCIKSAVDYLHSIGIAHLDLKPDNIILNDKWQVKLIDFGFASCKNPIHSLGSPGYAAPELLESNKEEKDRFMCDLWSLGMTIISIHTRLLIFKFANTKLCRRYKLFSERLISTDASTALQSIHPQIKIAKYLQPTINGLIVICPNERRKQSFLSMHDDYQIKNMTDLDLA